MTCEILESKPIKKFSIIDRNGSISMIVDQNSNIIYKKNGKVVNNPQIILEIRNRIRKEIYG